MAGRLNMETPTNDDAPQPCSPSQWNERVYAAKKEWHFQQAQLPIKEKMRIMLQMQRDALPLIARHRALKPHEKPWDIEP
jgi:hypothetical protein